MKTKASTQLPEKPKDKGGVKFADKSLTQKAEDQERFEDEILKINIKKPKNAFNFFIAEMRLKNKITGSITQSVAEYAKIYQNLPNSELKRFEELAEKDKQRYKEHTDLVKKYLMEKPLKENASVYSIFVDEKLREARESNSTEDPKEIRKAAKQQWEALLPEQRKIYEEKKEQHTRFYQDLRDSNKRVNAFTLFLQDEARAAEGRGEKVSKKDVSEKWKKLSDAAKERYAIYAQETLYEREQSKKLFMLAYGIKPKLPKSAYKFFISEKVKEGVLKKNLFKEASVLWDKLSEEEKEVYLKKAQKEKLTYELIKREHTQQNRKGNGPSAYNLFMRDLKGSEKSEYSEIGFLNYAYKKWKSLDKVLRNKYEKASKELKEKLDEEYEEKLRAEKNQAPKRPLTANNIYMKEKMPEFKKKYPKKDQTELFQLISNEFTNIPAKERKIYDEKAKKSKEEYQKLKKKWDLEQSKKAEGSADAEESKKGNNKKKSKKGAAGAAEDSSSDEDEEKGAKRKKNAKKSRSRTAGKNSKVPKQRRTASEAKLKNEEDEETAAEAKTSKITKNSKIGVPKAKNAQQSSDESEDMDESLKSRAQNQKKGKVTKQTVEEISSKPKLGRVGVKAGK